ncbi:ABC transporter substrate-binding protein [Thermogymnomonas acidicola]|uniref:ABC transporter substrate-binding protein n=1 Tax=Thermogymnomonas acidicola TaxID=399579 RepID=UPI000946516C|nr:ABC transporter substrate-binding protein [Thermogymnomonas acidicola]
MTIEANDLAYILSHFKLNYTDWKVMTYPDQAVYLPASEINSTDPLNVTIQTMYPPYPPFLLQDIASSYGAIIEPQYVDAHGGVNVSGENSYINQNGGALATGPYVISSVSSGYSTIVIVKNPHYWVDGHTVNNDTIVTVNSKTHMETISTPVNDVPYVASPPSIPEIVIEYGLSHADRIADFDTNLSQISTVGPTGFKQIINGYFNPSDRNTNLVQVIPEAGALYISLNVQRFPTNNTNFRAALYYAMNYSAQLALYDNNYNGSPLAYMELGPISPSYGLYYDPVHALSHSRT